MKKPEIHVEHPQINTPHFSNKSAIITTIILVLIGLSVILFIASSQIRASGWIETDAVVKIITDDNTFVTFSVGQQIYKEIPLNIHDSSIHLNDVIRILYNPADPTQIEYARQGFFNVFYIIGGTIMLIGLSISGVHFSIKAYRKKHPKFVNGLGQTNNDNQK